MHRIQRLITTGLIACSIMLCGVSSVAAGEPGVVSADQATRNLLRAADDGNLRGVEEALRAGARIDESRDSWTGPDGQPALVAAALRGHAEIVSLLLTNGADPQVTEIDGYNVWHAAAFQGHPAVLRVLIAADLPGYGMNERDGFTPLHRASWGRAKRHLDAVKLLVTEGGRACDERDRAGRTAAELAKSRPVREWLKACSIDGSRAEAAAPPASPKHNAASTDPDQEGAQ